MTLPDERYQAVLATRQFLEDLGRKEFFPRLPNVVRVRAKACLRHFPTTYDLDMAADASPQIFQKHLEPLYRMVKVYDKDKSNESRS